MSQTKFTKDEKQKIVLSTIGFIALLYVYFTFFLGPLSKSRAAMEKSIADLQSKVDSSKTEMQKAAKLEKQAAAAVDRFAALQALSPEGAPIAWFPPRMKTFFAAQTIERPTVRTESNGLYKQAELANWQRYNWIIELPRTDFITLGTTLAALENSEPLLSISRLSIGSVSDSPQHQQVSLLASVAIVKR